MTLCDCSAPPPGESLPYAIALAGNGPALDAIVDILEREIFISAFPRVQVAGWIPGPGEVAGKKGKGKTAIPPIMRKYARFKDVKSLFDSNPHIRLALDLSPDSRFLPELRQCAPPGVTVAQADIVLHFCAAAETGRLSIGGGDELRKAQGLFALLMDQIEGDILILDAQGRILDMNRRAAEIRGQTREELLGKVYKEIDALPDQQDDELFCIYEKSRETAKQAEGIVTQVMPSGRVRYLHNICIPVFGPPGSAPQYLFVRRDVTERYQLEKRLQQTERMAAIGELSTYMAHEIRNPLFSIGGFANSLLREASLDDRAREKARIIFDESRRLDEILTKILNFARPSEQKMGIFEPETVISQTLDLMTMGSEERGIRSIQIIAPGLPKVQGDAENLKQCLINLVKNALEAMPEGGNLIIRADRDNGYVQIDVEDTGEGIPPELQDQIFSPFFSTRHGGAGLGLAMVRKSVEEMGGKVSLSSEKHRGTKVSLFLPVALEVKDASDPQKAS